LHFVTVAHVGAPPSELPLDDPPLDAPLLDAPEEEPAPEELDVAGPEERPGH
jgi:hypothetical protein